MYAKADDVIAKNLAKLPHLDDTLTLALKEFPSSQQRSPKYVAILSEFATQFATHHI
jgi:hypothetical protein